MSNASLLLTVPHQCTTPPSLPMVDGALHSSKHDQCTTVMHALAITLNPRKSFAPGCSLGTLSVAFFATTSDHDVLGGPPAKQEVTMSRQSNHGGCYQAAHHSTQTQTFCSSSSRSPPTRARIPAIGMHDPNALEPSRGRQKSCYQIAAPFTCHHPCGLHALLQALLGLPALPVGLSWTCDARPAPLSLRNAEFLSCVSDCLWNFCFSI